MMVVAAVGQATAMKTVNATGNGKGRAYRRIRQAAGKTISFRKLMRYNRRFFRRSSAAFSGRWFRRSGGHDDDTVCPQEKVEHRGECGDVEYALCSEQSVDQRNSEKRTVGIDNGGFLDGRVRSLLTENKLRESNDEKVGETGSDQCPEKSVQKLPVEIDLIGLEDQERHHEQKQKIGELADRLGIQETGLINQNAAEKNEKHLSGFEDYGRSHGYR